MITGLRPETFTKLQLNAGIFLKDFDYSTATDAETLKTKIDEEITSGANLLGATRGGGTFECTPEMRSIEADGKRSEFIGSQVNDGWTIKLTGTMIEITPDNFATALMGAKVTKTGAKTVVQPKNTIADTDYIEKLCWIGDTSEGFVLIELDNALNVAGAAFTFTDKGEGTIPFEFRAHQSTLSSDTAPCRIVFFGKAA